MNSVHPAQNDIDALVAAGQLAGAVGLAWRNGRVAGQLVSGWRDLDGRSPMRRDALFRIASLTKPVTAVAALMLHDEGRFELEDPITGWAPEFRDMRVLSTPDGSLDDTVPAERPITFGDLLSHRAGFTYGAFHSGPLRSAYREALGADLDSHRSADEWVAALASLPLVDQPGRGFHYGVSIDLLGFLIARMEDAPLEDVLRQRIFAPLGMDDTGFDVPEGKRERVAAMYGFDDEGRLERRDSHPPEEPAFLPRRPSGATFVSGGAGLWSTADDYLTFARLFVEDGAVGDLRLLKLSTLRRMTANVLTPEQIAGATMMGLPAFSGQGFGLGVAVVLDRQSATVNPCKGGVGTVGWPGAYGGWWQADPTDGSVLVFLAHNALDFDKAARGLGLAVYSAINQFHASEWVHAQRL
ncbi:serine hydrolase domain-containing protein [Pyxidicoccus xibeiensis]|uniref:serine hydrolase domain-containing protein n=1 Tax=Pyxidicoccus xibeiensis TaxID=2906759 RepID=UPI0020A6DBCF|nr:serine hydrolase domain-containing protein [Pyxidicoccus xibeiensis]MCP3141943.1 beta-lactamase family protein [Pyxidicoccus xibeiensis]